MSIIRYRYKADKNFESVKIDGMSCSLGELKRLIAAKSSRAKPNQSKDDYDLIISNANTHEEYRDNSDLIPRNASVIVARRIRGNCDILTPTSNQKPVASSDDIVKDILLPAILNHNQDTSTTSSVIETQGIPLEKFTESTSHGSAKEMSEDEMIKEIQMGSQQRYVTQQQPYRTNLFVCHNCKQPGHIKSQCPLLSSSSNLIGNASGSLSSSSGDHASKGDGTQSINSGLNRQNVPHSSHIVTRHAPYQFPYHRGNRSHHRGSGHPRGEPLPKKTTGIPRDRLIPVPKHIPGALRDQSGASVVPRQMAELYVERIEKKADASAQRARQSDDKGFVPSVPLASKSTDGDIPPDDLLCPLCKRLYIDAVITPCCHLNFCDGCIRTALIESVEHECPHCHCQDVAIDQINPNLYLRNHVERWRDRQNKSSFSHMSTSQHISQTSDQDLDTTPTRTTNLPNSNDSDDYNAAMPQQSHPVAPVKTAPIVIKMQPHGKSQSPQPMVSTRPADMTFEDEKLSDLDQITSSQKDVHAMAEETNTFPSLTAPENEKPERETPPSQLAPISLNYSPPPPTTPNSVAPHYYPAPTHHNVIYPHHIPPAPSNGLYPIQQNYYPPPMGIRYPNNGMHHYPQFAPAPPVHHHHPIVPPPQHAPMNGYNVPTFHPHPAASYASTSTFITHHQQTATQPISTPIPAALSENEFYIKQRYFQRIQRSPSPRRSRSSSYSSYSSSDSRSSSRSRHDRRRRTSRSRSRRRIQSPIRDNRRQRRSSSYRNRRRPPIVNNNDNYSSKNRRISPRPTRDHERRRPPRPPPTVQQSTQRTIVYMNESSHSNRDRRRTKSRSRGPPDEHISPSTKKEQQPESTKTSTTLPSKIEPVVEETPLDSVQNEEKSNELLSVNSKSGKKHKKHHHHKKHRHQGSKSKKHRRSKDKEKKAIVDSTTSVIEVQS